mmetsp:Transcript_11716/g.27528  ORF Transcript_11716/g.27528 Transcript_11716/m.27528 type:complete len:132 (+) Transcript_11716:79-474(+)
MAAAVLPKTFMLAALTWNFPAHASSFLGKTPALAEDAPLLELPPWSTLKPQNGFGQPTTLLICHRMQQLKSRWTLPLAPTCSCMCDRYGHWQDAECQELKRALLALEEPGTGRVRLSRFYQSALGGKLAVQ